MSKSGARRRFSLADGQRIHAETESLSLKYSETVMPDHPIIHAAATVHAEASVRQLHILQHSLGVDQYEQRGGGITSHQTAERTAATVALPFINQLLQLSRHSANEIFPIAWASAVASSSKSFIANLRPQPSGRTEDIKLHTGVSRFRSARIDHVANHSGAFPKRRIQQVITSVLKRKVQVNLVNSDLSRDREAILCAASIVHTARAATGFKSMDLTRTLCDQRVRS